MKNRRKNVYDNKLPLTAQSLYLIFMTVVIVLVIFILSKPDKLSTTGQAKENNAPGAKTLTR